MFQANKYTCAFSIRVFDDMEILFLVIVPVWIDVTRMGTSPTRLFSASKGRKKSSLTLTLENQNVPTCVCVCVSIVRNFLIEKFWGTNFYGTGGLHTYKTYVSFFLSLSMISTWPDIPTRPSIQMRHQSNERYPNSSRYAYIMQEDRALSWRLSWRSVIKLWSPKGF